MIDKNLDKSEFDKIFKEKIKVCSEEEKENLKTYQYSLLERIANNYLKLNETKYELNPNKSYLEVDYDDNEKIKNCYLVLKFNEGIYKDDLSIAPSLIISDFKLDATNIDSLENKVFSMDNLKEIERREDTFYAFEHEPFLNYTIEIKKIYGYTAHIILKGRAVVDDISPDTKGEEFLIDVIVKIKEHSPNSKENIEKKDPKYSKEEIKNIGLIAIAGLINVIVGTLCIFEMINTGKIIYLLGGILMYIFSIFMVIVMALIRKKAQKN